MSKQKYKHYWSSYDGGCIVRSIEDDLNVPPNPSTITKGEKLADYSFIQSNLRNMLGRVLTVIDASIIEPRQNKAVKDIIRNEFIDEYQNLSDMLVTPEVIDSMMPDLSDEEFDKMKEATTEEIAGA